MENIFRSELIMPYRKTVTTGTGEWTQRNGENSIAIKPAPFYKNYSLNGTTINCILCNEFEPNTQYLIDLWIDADANYSSNQYNKGGLVVYYTDGTSTSYWQCTGGNGVGFQHKCARTAVGKSVKYIEALYKANGPIYYRWDSFIVPCSTTSINAKGQLITGTLAENQDTVAIRKGGGTYSNTLYEY